MRGRPRRKLIPPEEATTPIVHQCACGARIEPDAISCEECRPADFATAPSEEPDLQVADGQASPGTVLGAPERPEGDAERAATDCADAAAPAPACRAEEAEHRSLFSQTAFDVERAFDDIVRQAETTRLARYAYDLKREEATAAKKLWESRSKVLDELIRDLRHEQERAERAAQQPMLQVVDGDPPVIEAQASSEPVADTLQAYPSEDPMDDEALDDRDHAIDAEPSLDAGSAPN